MKYNIIIKLNLVVKELLVNNDYHKNMKLISVLNTEVIILKCLAQCATVYNKTLNLFTFNKLSYILQILGLIVFVAGRILLEYFTTDVNDTNQTKKYLVSHAQEPDFVVTFTVIVVYSLYENYVWISLNFIRFFQRNQHPKIYNNLLAIDQELVRLNPKTNYVQRVSMRYFCRITIFFAIDLMHTIDKFHSNAPHQKALENIATILLRMSWKMIVSQQLTAYETLRIQTETLGKIVDNLKSLEKLVDAHWVLVRILHTKRLLDKTFNKQFFVDIGGCIIVLLLMLTSATITISNGIPAFFRTADGFLLERDLLNLSSWMIFNFYTLQLMKSAFSEVITKIQAVSVTFQRTGFYFLLNEGDITLKFVAGKTFIGSTDLKVLFSVRDY